LIIFSNNSIQRCGTTISSPCPASWRRASHTFYFIPWQHMPPFHINGCRIQTLELDFPSLAHVAASMSTVDVSLTIGAAFAGCVLAVGFVFLSSAANNSLADTYWHTPQPLLCAQFPDLSLLSYIPFRLLPI
jgi:hypothetical protein